MIQLTAQGDTIENGVNSYYIDTDTSLSELPTDFKTAKVGSSCFCAKDSTNGGKASLYMLSFSGVWEKIE